MKTFWTKKNLAIVLAVLLVVVIVVLCITLRQKSVADTDPTLTLTCQSADADGACTVDVVLSGLMGVTYYLAGGASNFLVFTNYLQGGQMNTVWAIVGMAISFAIAAAVVFVTGFSKEELAEMEA